MKKHKKTLLITKRTGEKVPFNEDKLRLSLERSDTDEQLISKVINEVKSSLFDGITTREIYQKAFSLLKKESKPTAARYKLKKAMFELGPSGFPFERYVADIMRAEGFKTQVDVIVQGHCVSHEIDVIATMNNKSYLIECKFHHEKELRCDVKVPLYIHSRYRDIQNAQKTMKEGPDKYIESWIVTNTRFTSDAEAYGTCSGLKLISWDYPKGESLRERIDASGLHPVTSLSTITIAEKEALLNDGLVLCRDLCRNPKPLKKIGVKEPRLHKVLEEAGALCKLENP